MACFRTEILERVAIRLAGSGLDRRATLSAESPAAPEVADSETRQILLHAWSCVRCRAILDICWTTEEYLPAALAQGSAPASGAPTLDPEHSIVVLELRPIPLRAGPVSASAADPSPAHALAADTGDEREEGAVLSEAPVLSVSSEDGHFLVRIFNQAGGDGATAILLHAQSGPQADTDTALPRSGQRRVSLIVRGVEYAFDEKGLAALPHFPAEPIALVVRG